MTKAAKMGSFISTGRKKETPLDKTARIVRRITEDEAEVRHIKTARLRKARFESEEDTVAEADNHIAYKTKKDPLVGSR